MKALFAALFALALGLGVTLLAQQDPGYVLLRYRGWSVETSLTIFTVLLLAAFLLFYLLLRLLWRIWHLPGSLVAWLLQRRALANHRLGNKGLQALAEGKWSLAEKLLSRAASRSDTPLSNYLAAAIAAQQAGSLPKRDYYLALASRHAPKARLAVGLTQARLQFAQGQLEHALATLQELHHREPRNGYLLAMLKEIYERLHSWEALHRLLPELRRQQVLQGEQLEQFEQKLYTQLIEASDSAETLQACWEEVPRGLRQQARMLVPYVQRLIALEQRQEAEDQLHRYLKRHYDPQLASLYGLLEHGDAKQRLDFLERWLSEHGEDPELLLAVGRLALQDKLWGKARSYLEASLAREERQATRHLLAELLLQLGEEQLALATYRQQPVA